jgi:CheY-like chemotaxis protein
MLVEDNPTNAFYARRVLEGMGCEVTLAASGEEALVKYKPSDHQLVLLDLHMPGMGGMDLLRAIREREAKESLHEVPVLILTADVLSSTREACLASGANGFLSKPVRPTELYDALDRYFVAKSLN